MLIVNQRIQVPLRELQFSFVRSSGPGGQNVNKVSTKAVLQWRVVRNRTLPPDVRERFLQEFKRRVTKEGWIVITSQRFRDQSRNVADCVEKLRAMLEAVAVAPKPRKPTRPSRGARERRLQTKRLRSARKRLRGTPSSED